MLVPDLTGVRFLAVSGIRVLLETRVRVALTETSLGLVHSMRAVSRVLDVLQLNNLFQTYPTLADVVASQCEPLQLCATARGRTGYWRRSRGTTTPRLIRLRSNTGDSEATDTEEKN